ncbi:MAG: HAD-IIB family hydrolase [Acutalibacteraceae bacterium]
MEDKNIYAVFLDIDGTLMSGGVIPQKNIDAIKKAQAKGHKIFINSGRAMGNINDEIRSISFDGYVAGIGCNVIYGDETLLAVTVETSDAAKVFDYFTKTGRSIVLEGEKMLIANSDCKWQDFATAVDGEDYLRRFGNERITKIFIPHVLTQSELDAIGKKYLIYQHSDYAEFSAKNCTKATGMDLILKHCGIPVERSIAMGDSSNDIEMLKFAGISVAMGDGEKAVRDMCKIITAPAGEGGVADALERLLGV